MSAPAQPRILPCGDAALTVEFGRDIDPAVNARVLALDARVGRVAGVLETVPTYRSLLVHYDPSATDFRALAAASIEAPSGWRLLGRTPVRNFMLDRDPVFILEPGDRIVFAPIAAERWDDMDRAAAAGDLVAEA